MNRQILIEENIGETRAAVAENGRIVELHLDRWSEAGQRAVEGEIYRGRIRRVEPALNAAFVDLGVGEEGFLPFGKAGRPKGLHEGAAIGVRIAREAYAEKGPNLGLVEVEPGEAPDCLEPADILAQRLVRTFSDAEPVWADETDYDLEEAFDEALEPQVAIPGGGSLYIEATRAMTTIDVDADGRKGQGNAAQLAVQLNNSAAKEAARQARMRGIGGMIAIDFVHMRGQPDRKAVEQTLRGAFRRDRAKVDVAPLSQFCIGEIARQRRGRTLAEIMLETDGRPTVETAALAALRRLEGEARSDRARKLRLTVGAEVYAWLDGDSIAWRAALADRIGPRFELAESAELDRETCRVARA
ncbi:ribonuclease E/G [Maricaulis maris]|uniref:Rne/Rng family ribonuclease n=1 Tax=Maricaulis maris TaxID=74318 RepID=A0A495D272_9PROT|nr:ribonuclease E/G [Maricaulis maris]RKQ95635.1 Rne/Rng family ribonuclease [Maricaulis maris]